MTRSIILLVALAFLGTPAVAQQKFPDDAGHIATGTATQDLLCDQERFAGPCDPYAVTDSVAHTTKALPGFLNTVDGSGLTVTKPGGVATPLSKAVNITCIPIDLFGGDPTGANFSDAAWTAVIGIIGNATGCVDFSAGFYKFANAASVVLSATTANSIAVRGPSSGSASLYWPNGGGLSFTMLIDRNSFKVSGLKLITGAAGTTNSITATNTFCQGNNKTSIVSDVVSVGYDTDQGTGNSDYWNVGLSTTNVSAVGVYDYTVFGASGNNGSGIAYAGTPPNSTYPSGCFATVQNINDFNMFGGNIGYSYGAYAQGVTIGHSNFVNGNLGIFFQSGILGTDQLNVHDSNFDDQEGDIAFNSDMFDANIHDNLFFVTGGHSAIEVTSGSGYNFHGNVFTLHPGTSGSTQAILVSGNDGGQQSVITDNVYRSLTSGNGFSSGTSGWNVQTNAYFSVASPNVNSSATCPTSSPACNTIGGGSP